MTSLKEHVELRLIFWALLAGLALIPLLPIGMFLGIHSSVFTLAFALHMSFLAVALLHSAAALWRIIAHSWEDSSWDFRILLCFAIPAIIGVISLLSATPITARDALIHHLAVPRWWVEAGSITEIRWHEWSYYPMLLSLGFSGFLAHALDYLTPWYHLCYLMLLCAISAQFTYVQTGNSRLAALAALCLSSLPICVRLASTPLVDLGLAAYSGIAIFSGVRWLKSPHSVRLSLYSGAALGLALSCKLNALLVVALLLPALFVCGNLANIPRSLRVKSIAIMAISALAVYSPWLIRNYAWVGNPFFPLYRGLFGPANLGSVLPPGLNPVEQRMAHYGESVWELLLLPVRILVSGADDNPRLFDGRLSPILLLALLPLVKLRREPWVVLFYFFSFSYLLFALVMSGARVRYLAPIYAPMTILSVIALPTLLAGARLKALASAAILLHLIVCISYYAATISKDHSIEYATGKISRQEYLSTHIPEYEMAQYMNQNLSPASLTYLLGTGNRFYLYHTPVRSGGHYSAGALVYLIRLSQNPSELADALKREGYTHLMAHVPRSSEMMNNILTQQEKTVWSIFQHEFLEGITISKGHALWRIK